MSSYRRVPTWAQYLVFGCALLCYTAPWWLYPVKALQTLPLITDGMCVLGGSALIILALASLRLSQFLLLPPLVFLGRISFSVYLYHVIILVAAINLFYGSLNLWLILFLVVVITLAISSGAYYAIEKPSLALGHKLTRKRRLWGRKPGKASSQLSV